MLKKLDFENFFVKENACLGENGMGGVGIISPTQSIHVINLPGKNKGSRELVDGLGLHITTELEILKEMFDINYNEKIVGYDTVLYREICKKIPNAEQHLITIRYIAQVDKTNNNLCSSSGITIPMYINQYQLEELECLNDTLKSLNVSIDVEVINYNPITSSYEEIEPEYFDEEKDNLDKAIKYLQNNNRVVEYNLSVEEQIVKIKQNKKRTK